MGKARRLVLDECVTKTVTIETRRIDSMTNKAYKKSINTINRVIERNNKQFAEAQLRAAKMIIKSGDEYSLNSNISAIMRIANDVKQDGVNKNVLNAILEASMYSMPSEEVYYQVLSLKNVEKSKSIKLYNVRFNLKKCWQLICESYAIIDNIANKEFIGLTISVLNTLKSIFNIMTIEISLKEAILISTIISYGGSANAEEIKGRIKASNLVSEYGEDFINCEWVDDSLKSLELINTISLNDNNKYELNEEVII